MGLRRHPERVVYRGQSSALCHDSVSSIEERHMFEQLACLAVGCEGPSA